MATVYRKAGDTEPILATLKNRSGRPINVTGATVVMIARPQVAGIGIGGEFPCLVTDGVNGEVSTTVEEDELPAAPGGAGDAIYDVVYEIAFASSQVKTVPNRGYERLVIQPGLD